MTRRRNPNNLLPPPPELRPEPPKRRDPRPFAERFRAFVGAFARALRRWSVRSLWAVVLLNLGWDILSWCDRAIAGDDRRFFRGAERPETIEYGLAEVTLVNEMDHDFLIDSFVLDNWGGPLTHRPRNARSVMPSHQLGSIWTEIRYIDRLSGGGEIYIRRNENSAERRIRFSVDRRRPISCRVEIRIKADSVDVSGCRMIRRLRPSWTWMADP